MSQFARPISPDVAVNSWTPTPLYEEINEETYSDTDYIQRNGINYCEVTLSSLSDPVSSSAHYVRYRLGRSRTDRTLTVVVRLMEGSTEIASWTHVDPGASFQPFEQTLTTGEADSISSSGYANLRLRFDITALQNTQVYCQVSWAEMEVPDAGVVDRDVSESESVTVSDTPTASVSTPPDSSISKAETVTAADTPTAEVTGGVPEDRDVSKAESVTASDTPTISVSTPPDSSISESETTTVSDTPTVSVAAPPDSSISKSETITVSDTPNASIAELPDRDITKADSAIVADVAAAVILAVAAAKSENLTIADVVVALSMAIAASKSDSVTTSDDPTVSVQSVAGETLGIAVVSDDPNYWTGSGVIIVG